MAAVGAWMQGRVRFNFTSIRFSIHAKKIHAHRLILKPLDYTIYCTSVRISDETPLWRDIFVFAPDIEVKA